MNTEHLTMEQLLALREPGEEPGRAALRSHLEGCARCRLEQDRLDQRVARLRALPRLRPARDRWPGVAARLAAERRAKRVRWIGMGGLALAASVALMLLVDRPAGPAPASAATEAISEARERSRELEDMLRQINPEQRAIDGRTARVAAELEDRISMIDDALQAAQLLGDAERDAALARLWSERVGLLDALVDVHVTRASAVGM
ncbi:MAG: hypothetical protein ACOY71_04715 [Gemmatimonadota bacterium]